jgi:hypothetical protein
VIDSQNFSRAPSFNCFRPHKKERNIAHHPRHRTIDRVSRRGTTRIAYTSVDCVQADPGGLSDQNYAAEHAAIAPILRRRHFIAYIQVIEAVQLAGKVGASPS